MTLSYRTRLFVALALVAAVASGVAAILIARALARDTTARIERSLVSEARLTAELLEQSLRDAADDALDEEADRLGDIIDARVTLVSGNGTVLGDSAEDGESLARLENHAQRPEIVDALRSGTGLSRRYSTTVNVDMLYVAVPAKHPRIAIVRLALPLTEVRAQIRVVRRAAAVALLVALGCAVVLSGIAAALLASRLKALATRARHYASRDLLRATGGYGGDEIGQLGRALDDSFRELNDRLSELERSRARIAAILSGMVEGVIVVDGDGRMQLVNDSARAMLDLDSAGPAVGPYLHAIRHPDVSAQFDAAMAGRTPDAAEIVLPSNRVTVARAVPLAHGGAVLVLHDITRLRHADQIRRDFVANVSHELRTPLTAIRGYAEALRDDTLAPAERERFLAIIGRHTDRMARIVQDLLRLARLDAGQEPVERVRCDVAALFATVIADLRPRIDARGQRIAVVVAPGAGQLRSDPSRLEEIVKNLVENASNYAPENTEIRLESERQGQRHHIRVLDQGPGIPPADLTRIFERFYRVDTARSRESGGTGLGLSIVKHLAERLGGEVHAENRPAGGARFTVSLPAA